MPILVRVTAIPNNPLTIEFKFGNVEVCVQGCLVEQAKNAPLSESQIADSVSKLGDTYFVADGVVVQTFDAFVPKSAINELRRIAATQLYIAIVNEYETKNCKNFIKNKQNKLKNIHINNKFNYYIIEKISDIERVGDEDAIIVYAPEIYSIENVKCVKTMVEKQFNTKLFLYLPVIANHEDLKLLGEIIRSFPCEQIGLVAGSLYGLYFLDCGYEVVCGTNINISNNYTIRTLQELGACNFVQSIEENLFKVIDGAHKYIGSPCVMTLAMCPFIEHCNSKCNNCKYVPNTELIMDNNAQFIIRRQKISNCYFDLVWKSKKIYPEGTGYMIDLRD